jgi:uncharacterized membrane protein YoaK (UPF0700 family)
VRPAERDLLLFLLALAAGSADGWSYFGLGHAFVANMTGNTVLIGMAVFQHTAPLTPAISLGCYAVGAALAALITRNICSRTIWPAAVSRTLLLETLLLTAAATGWVLLHRTGLYSSAAARNLLLACVAAAIGMQSGALLQLKIPGIVTTYVTGTLTSLITGLARLLIRQPRRRSHTGQFEDRLLLQAGILATYLLAAVATGWICRYHPLAVGALPATAVLAAAAYGTLRPQAAATTETAAQPASE